MNKRADGTIELTITIPWVDVEATYQTVVTQMVESAEVKGFRKGKAPRALVEKKLDKTAVYEKVIKQIIPKAYAEAVTAQNIRPIVNPAIELKEAQEKKDWILVARTCEKPAVTLGDYKAKVAEAKVAKHKKIWVPGQDKKEEDKTNAAKPSLDDILTAILDAVTISLPDILVEQEVNRLLADLIDQTKKLGISVEQYLASTGRTSDSIRQEYRTQASRTLTLEFALEEIADNEGISVSDEDIDAVIKTAKTEEEKQSLSAQRYYVASLLRRQKTLDFLTAL